MATPRNPNPAITTPISVYISTRPIAITPPLATTVVGDERALEVAEPEGSLLFEAEVEPAAAVVELVACSDEVDFEADEDASDSDFDDDFDDDGVDDADVDVDPATELVVDVTVPGAEEVVVVPVTLFDSLEEGGAEVDEDGGGVLELLPPPLGTGTTTPPSTVPPDCEVVPAAFDL